MSSTTGLLMMPVWRDHGFIHWVQVCIKYCVLLIEAIHTIPQELPTIFTSVASSQAHNLSAITLNSKPDPSLCLLATNKGVHFIHFNDRYSNGGIYLYMKGVFYFFFASFIIVGRLTPVTRWIPRRDARSSKSFSTCS